MTEVYNLPKTFEFISNIWKEKSYNFFYLKKKKGILFFQSKFIAKLLINLKIY